MNPATVVQAQAVARDQCLAIVSASRSSNDADERPSSRDSSKTPRWKIFSLPLHIPRGPSSGVLWGSLGAGIGMGIIRPGNAEAKRLLDLDGEGEALVFDFNVVLRLVGLRGSVPPAWISQFRRTQSPSSRVYYSQRAQIADIFKELEAAQGSSSRPSAKSAAAADAVTLGDAWLAHAIRKRLIAPLTGRFGPDALWSKRLPPHLAALARRDPHTGAPSATGLLFGVPYRWGCLLIAFRQDKLRALGLGDGLEWKDLWRPELKGRVSFPDEPRTLLGVVFKEAGLPFDAPEGEGEGKGSRGADWEHLQERLRVLKGQVLTTNSTFYLKSLVAGDAWVAVGWSTDLIPFARSTANISLCVPPSGTALWADFFVLPSRRVIDPPGPSPLLPQWFNFVLQPARADLGAGIKLGASPLLLPPPLPALGTLATAAPAASSKAAAKGEGKAKGKSPAAAVADPAAAAAASETPALGKASGQQPVPVPVKGIVDGLMPEEGTLRRSSFMSVLSPAAAKRYAELLAVGSGVAAAATSGSR